MFDYKLAAILILCLCLGFLANLFNEKTLEKMDMADGTRWYSAIQFGEADFFLNFFKPAAQILSEWDFTTLFNMLLYYCVGLAGFFCTRNYLKTLVLVLGFAWSIVMIANLYSQAILMIGILVFFGFKEHSTYGWIAFMVFCYLAHPFGLVIFGAIALAKFLENRVDNNKIEILLILSLIAIILVVFAFTIVPHRMSIFYPTIIPFDMDKINNFIWLATLTIPLWYLLFTSLNEKNRWLAIFASLMMVGASLFPIINHPYEIDFWRILAFFEFAAIIGLSYIEKIRFDWLLKVLVLFGIERFLVLLL